MKLYERKYGSRSDAPILATAISLLKKHYQPTADTLHILDVGGGNMLLAQTFLDLFRETLSTRSSFSIEGWDISEKGVAQAKAHGFDSKIRDISSPLGNEERSRYDMVLFFEVLEHLVDTDAAIRNIYAILKPNGILVMSTPNLASWYNRVFLLFGNQPHCTEVSSAPVRFGNRITHKFLGETEGKTDIAAGHLRVFTWKALREFLDYFEFDIIAAKGCANHKSDIISRVVCPLFIGLAGDICVIARKKTAAQTS